MLVGMDLWMMINPYQFFVFRWGESFVQWRNWLENCSEWESVSLATKENCPLSKLMIIK